jgi:hypothetical protein
MKNEDWMLFSREIDVLLRTGHYAWVEDLLRRMQTLAETRHHVTDGQRLAVKTSVRRENSRRCAQAPPESARGGRPDPAAHSCSLSTQVKLQAATPQLAVRD